jgi:hypothetical protein
MDTQVETISDTNEVTAGLIRAVFDSEMSGRMRSLGEMRLAVLQWVLDLAGDPATAARAILARRADSQARALPQAVVEILQEIAATDIAGIARRGRRARRRLAN